ncbi:MAG TPA: hypothetical protein VK427_17080 [Kofleriaceae bacterium]|nr:hypothetical protein [Kofleriaceae bacterium]
MKTPILDAPVAPLDRKSEIRDLLNGLFRSQELPGLALVDGSGLVIMTTVGCNKKVLSNFRKLLVAMENDPSDAFDTFECSNGEIVRFRGKDDAGDSMKRAKRTIRTVSAASLSKFLVANGFPFDVVLVDDEEAIAVTKLCNAKVLDHIAGDEIGESMQRGGFKRVTCKDGSETRELGGK